MDRRTFLFSTTVIGLRDFQVDSLDLVYWLFPNYRP